MAPVVQSKFYNLKNERRLIYFFVHALDISYLYVSLFGDIMHVYFLENCFFKRLKQYREFAKECYRESTLSKSSYAQFGTISGLVVSAICAGNCAC